MGFNSAFKGLSKSLLCVSHLMMVTQFLLITVVGEDFWRWQTMNPDGYRGTSSSSASRTSVIVNGSHLNGHWTGAVTGIGSRAWGQGDGVCTAL